MPISNKQNSPLQEERWNRLLRLMETERLYLDPFLMQEDVSERLFLSNRTLSRLLSDRAKQNFCSFVNAYRLMEAQRLLLDENLGHTNVLSIANQSGFNSGGTFYRAFRESAGMSPTGYRKLHRKRAV